jgi:hypothetical protein
MELARSQQRLLEAHIRGKIARWLSAQFLDELVRYELAKDDSRWRLQFHVDSAAFHRLMTRRLGRTLLVTNRLDWTPEEVVAGYAGQQLVELISATIIGPFRNFVLAHHKWLMVIIIPSFTGIFACYLFSQAESMPLNLDISA